MHFIGEAVYWRPVFASISPGNDDLHKDDIKMMGKFIGRESRLFWQFTRCHFIADEKHLLTLRNIT